jgi:hypothetical protein
MPEAGGDAEIAAMQADFARRLFLPDEPPPAALSGKDHARLPVRRFDVYRNNVLASLTGVVRARFPVVLRLLGEQFFAGMARSFVERHPPRVPVLAEYGAELPGFLETFEPVSDLPYLPDVARVEWAMHAAYHAADRESLAPAQLSLIPPESIAGARLVMHPSVSLVASPYPVVSIWETNSLDDEVRPIGPDQEGEQALVVRPELDVRLLRVSPTTLALALSILEGADIGRAFEVASECAPVDDISQSLAALLGAGAIIDAQYDAPGRGRVMLTSITKAEADAYPR